MNTQIPLYNSMGIKLFKQMSEVAEQVLEYQKMKMET